MFEILIKNLKLFGFHGVNENEKINGQEFIFNVKIKLLKDTFRNENAPGYADTLSGTVNYSDIIRIIKRINSSNKFDLLETLAEDIAGQIFSYSDMVKSLKVCIEKSNPPIDEILESVGVRFSAERSSFLNKGSVDKGYSKSRKIFFLSIGSNIGDREKHLRDAVGKVSERKNIRILKVSSIYETEPMYLKNQPDFFNIVLKGEIEESGFMGNLKCDSESYAFEFLGFLKSIEYLMKRYPAAQRNGPRIIDLDLVDFDKQVIESDILKLPHPAFKERNFVLIPLSEIEPGFIIDGMNIVEFIANANLKDKIRKLYRW